MLDGVKVWVMKYYPEAKCYSYHNGYNQYGFCRHWEEVDENE